MRATASASGVVRPGPVRFSSASSSPRVPRLAALRPRWVKIWRQKVATDVLPLVPVTATITGGCAPQNRAAARA